MSAFPATKPSAARLRLSASSLLQAASRVEVTAGKTAFGEQVGTVFDEKHDYAKQVASRQSQSYPWKVLRAYT
eukprot:4154233-Pyramimonas_sp.AAC.1